MNSYNYKIKTFFILKSKFISIFCIIIEFCQKLLYMVSSLLYTDAPRIKKEGLFTFPKKLRNSWPCECVVETEPDLIAGAGTGAGEKAPAPGR